MIVRMKKIFLIALKKDAEKTLEDLRELGVVHVEPQTFHKHSILTSDLEEISRFEQAVSILRQERLQIEQRTCDDANVLVKNILDNVSDIQRLTESVTKRAVRLKNWEPWGDFDPDDIIRLAEQGIYIHLYQAPVAQLAKKEIPPGVILEVVNNEGGIARCVAVMREERTLPLDRIALPPNSIHEKRMLQEKEQKKIEELKQTVREHGQYLHGLEGALQKQKEMLRFKEVMVGLKEDEELTLLKGFCPVDHVHVLERTVKEKKWGLVIEKPGDDDRVPTYLKNPKWVSVIKPVFSMINVLPGYKELDISVVFLFFFSLFVGMLVGDAGYGVLLLLLFGGIHAASAKKIKDHTVFILIYLLCLCTVFWGVLTGVYFGQEWISASIKPLVPWLNDINNIQMFCFLIGAVHLSIAHSWRAVVKAPSPEALAEIGWLSIVWGMFFTAKMLVLGSDFPSFAKYFFFIGSFLIIFFTKPNRNPLKAIGPGVGGFLLNVINTFTDVVSYIRLYAVGLATVAVADAANAMGFAGLPLHALNIVLAAMAVLVHGLRLNVLEFSGHMGMEWTGVKYDPFRIEKV